MFTELKTNGSKELEEKKIKIKRKKIKKKKKRKKNKKKVYKKRNLLKLDDFINNKEGEPEKVHERNLTEIDNEPKYKNNLILTENFEEKEKETNNEENKEEKKEAKRRGKRKKKH